MADVRDTVLDAQGALELWFDVESGSGINDDDIGKPCAMTGNKEVSDGADGEACAGKIVAVWPNGASEATRAKVRVKGLCADLAYAGTAPVVGHPVVMQAAHKVQKGATGSIAVAQYNRGLVVNVDTTAVTCDVLF